MKKKTKFIMVAMALCLTVALGVLGIFAVKTLNMTVGGNITFSADGISFTITDGTFKTTSNAVYTGINNDNTKLKGFAMNTNTTQASVQDKIDSWTNLNLTMSSLGDAVLHFSITNNMTTETLYAYLDISHGENTNNNMAITQTGGGEAIAPNQTKAFTLTFDIIDETINAALTGFKVDMLLTRTQKQVVDNQTPSGLIPIAPEKVENFVEPRIVVQRPAFKYVSDSTRPALRFKMVITNELKQELEADPSKKLMWILMPTVYYDKANPNNYTTVDWINELSAVGISMSNYLTQDIDLEAFYEEPNGVSYGFQMREIRYSNLFLRFCAMGVVVTTNQDGSVSYKYSQFSNGDDYRSNARSVADVLSDEFNARACGEGTRPDAEYVMMEKYYNECVDKANGLASATDDGSKFNFTINLAILKTFAVGVTVPLEVKISPLADVYAQYKSSNESVVKVDEDGNMTTIAPGTATISVSLFGEEKTITINVA